MIRRRGVSIGDFCVCKVNVCQSGDIQVDSQYYRSITVHSTRRRSEIFGPTSFGQSMPNIGLMRAAPSVSSYRDADRRTAEHTYVRRIHELTAFSRRRSVSYSFKPLLAMASAYFFASAQEACWWRARLVLRRDVFLSGRHCEASTAERSCAGRAHLAYPKQTVPDSADNHTYSKSNVLENKQALSNRRWPVRLLRLAPLSYVS